MVRKHVLVLFIAASFAACSGGSAEKRARDLARSYGDLTRSFDQKRDELNARMRNAAPGRETTPFVEEYSRLQGERRQQLEALLKRGEGLRGSDALDLVRSKIMIELDRLDDAAGIVDRLAKAEGALGDEARLQKVVLHLVRREYPQAAGLFRSLLPRLNRDNQFYNVCLALAFSHPDPAARAEFSQALIDDPGLPAHVRALLPRVHANLAMLAKESGRVAEAQAQLDKALALHPEPALKASWESERRQLTLLGQDPPALDAESWLNALPQPFAALRGKVVVLDFWAPWCAPCRQVMPMLQEQYRKHKGDGLVVIGYTRLYGRYADEIEKKPQVTATEELSLIRRFVDRQRIGYPVAVSTEGRAFDSYAVTAIPTMAFINRKGKIAYFKTGSGTLEQIAARIAALLAEE